MCNRYVLFLFVLVSSSIQASQVVSSYQCTQLSHADQPFLLILKRDQRIPEEIIKCIEAAKLSGASISAIGALKNPVIAYFNVKTKKYQSKTFKGVYQLLALNGNLSFIQDKPFLHLHAVLGDRQYRAMGGCLVKATVGVTAEIAITPITTRAARSLDESFDLNLIHTDNV